MFESPTFQSAAARRKGQIISFTIDHVRVKDDGSTEPLSRKLRIDPLLDIVRIGVIFGSFSKTLARVKDSADADEMLAALDKELPRAISGLRSAIVPHDREAYDEVSDAIDTQMLGQIIRFITNELSSLDPTQPAESSAGSTPTGSTSTDGAQPEA